MPIAYCFANGDIHVDDALPPGALPIARAASERTLREAIACVAREGREYRGWYVPGVAEASTPAQALAALLRFIDWLAEQYLGIETESVEHVRAQALQQGVDTSTSPATRRLLEA
ncbi:hypothetical protein [Halotalea alkalilenta]|uniref:hypothetical protein n=1 Tax=Halotalea alkalilenta TaxID=376489 RepID=UPI000695018E|nr:hypothetical protein [Halotalea alkalilenta]